MNAIIKIENLTKKFGDVTALENVNLSFERGKIYGIIGRNGSGKTVLFKLITGYLKPTGGRVVVNGKEIGKDVDFAENIGIIIENPGFLNGYTGYKNLAYLAGIRNVIGREEIRESMEKVGLDPDSGKKVGKYSLGMKQRLGIAQAIMEDPEILILDEPMNSLDNQGVEDVRELLMGLRDEGKTILLASHNKEDIEILCDEVYEMDRGRLRVGITGIRRPFTIFSVIPRFKQKYPNVDLTLNEFASDKLEEMLEGLELDCAAVNVTRKRDCFEYLPIAREEYVLAVHKDHPLLRAAERSDKFKYPVVRPGQLEGCSFIMLGKAHRIRRFADSILDGNRIGYSISMQSLTLDGALEAVANGLGCTFTPEVMLSYIRGSRNIRCLSLDTPGTGYEFSLLYRKGAYLPPSTQDFLSMFREAFRDQRESGDYYG